VTTKAKTCDEMTDEQMVEEAEGAEEARAPPPPPPVEADRSKG
jgi:hypothetical protein